MPFLHATGKFSMLNRTKMYGFVWTCLTVWMLMKQRQKFFDGYEQLDNLLCQMTMSCNCIQLGQSSFLLLFFVLFYYLITSCVVLLSWCRNKDVCVTLCKRSTLSQLCQNAWIYRQLFTVRGIDGLSSVLAAAVVVNDRSENTTLAAESVAGHFAIVLSSRSCFRE